MTRASFWRWSAYALLSILLYALFLLVSAPAEYLARAVAHASRGAVVLQQPSGSFWHGNAMLVVTSAGNQPLGQVQWVLHPWRMLTGSIGADLQFTNADTELRAQAQFGLRRHILRDITAVAPASVVMQAVPLANALGLSGRLRLSAPHMELEKDALHGSAELTWQNAASQLLPVNPAGDYKLEFKAQGKRVVMNVATLQGTLQLSAQGDWNLLENGVLKLDGTLGTSSPQPSLEPILGAIGTAQPDGRRKFTYELRLRPLQPATLFPL